MGKRKTQKTKEIAVAIAETSSSSKSPNFGGAQSFQPRKRGRPRKVVDEPENEEKNKKLPSPEVTDRPPEKKGKTAGEEQPPPDLDGPAKQEQEQEQEQQEEPKSGDGSRSRGRRKNKPRKSS